MGRIAPAAEAAPNAKPTQRMANGVLGTAASGGGVVALLVWIMPNMPAEVAAFLGAGCVAGINVLGTYLRNKTGDSGVSRWVG